MPVQDNDDKRTADQPAVDAEEELRRKTAAMQEQQGDTSVHQSGKLLPFLNAKAEHHQSRIDSLDGKIATQQDKITKHEAKIEQLTAKADKLEDTNRMLKATLGNIPLVRTVIKNNENRINAIRNEKIPNRQQKIEACKGKIEQFSAKRSRITHKLNRVIALNDTIKSFGISFNKERREVFADAMSRLNGATADCLSDKRDNLISQKNELLTQYDDPKTFIGDKLNIQKKIDGLNERIYALDSKIMKLARPESHYAEQTNDQLDASMKLTSDKLGEMVQNGTFSMPDLAEGAVTAAQRVEELDKSHVAALADQLGVAPLDKVEEQLEDDYNMIDGIINNGSKSDLEQAKTELIEGMKSMQEIASNPFVSKDMHDMAVQNLAQMQEQLTAIDTAIAKLDAPFLSPNALDEINADEILADSEMSAGAWLMDMVEQGKAEFSNDGSFKVNPDYYKELPRNDRHVESMTEAQAVEVMSALSAAGIEFSAASKGDDKVGITVSKKDLVALNDVMYATIGKIAKTEAVKENAGKGEKGKYQTINPEYYASLGKDDKHTRVEPIDTARKIVAELQKQNIPYSAVVRKNETVAVTVSKANAPAYKQIESAVKGERAVELVNPEFFKALPKQERFTQRMDEGQARKKSAELTAKGIEHSAVFGGEKSAVTVAKKDSKKAFVSRSMMRKEAQRVKQQSKPSPEKPQTRKRNDQGLD